MVRTVAMQSLSGDHVVLLALDGIEVAREVADLLLDGSGVAWKETCVSATSDTRSAVEQRCAPSSSMYMTPDTVNMTVLVVTEEN